MSAKTGGSLATILMSVPLAAIPLMAIFGIPQFTEVVASPENADHNVIVRETDPALPQGQNSFPDRSSTLINDAPADATRRSYDPQTLGNPFDPPANPFAGMPLDPDREQHLLTGGNAGSGNASTQPPPETGQGGPPPGGHSVATGQTEIGTGSTASLNARSQMSWRAATRRLQELGIDNYHLERGESFDSFLFVCSFEPAGATNVVMRFEAEADEPLAAVTDVLDQIDRWLRRSFAESRQAALISNGAAQ